MTSPDKLRERIARELDTLAPTEVVDRARTAGEKKLRHRRAGMGAAVLGVSALAVAGYVVTAGPAPSTGDRVVLSDPAAEAPDLRDAAATVIAEARADGKVTEQEWLGALDATFDALLPQRFRGVDQVKRPDGLTQLRTRGDDPRFDSWVSIQGYEGPRSSQPGYDGCAGLRDVVDDADFEWVIVDCADGEIAGGELTYLADREVSALEYSSGDDTDPDAAAGAGAAVIVLGDGFFLEWGMAGFPDQDRQITFTADEMSAVVTDPLFLDVAELGTTYFADRPQDPRSVVVVTDPVWPL